MRLPLTSARRRVALVLPTLALVTFAGACQDPTVVLDRFVSVVTLTPAGAQLAVGDTLRFAAVSIGEPFCVCRWVSSDPGVAAVSSAGLVRALTPGRATLTATLARDSTARAYALIEVRAP
jgi:uncharacterized protein YjdB